MTYYENILGLIGHTPLVKINRLNKGLKPLILAKMENLNPGFSVKDRIGISMIESAEREGKLKPGGTIVEATSGNTGIGLALAASVRGYKCIFVMTDKASAEKSRYLKALGADVVITPVSAKPGTPDHYVSTARRIAGKLRIRFIRTSTLIRRIPKRIIARRGRNFGNRRKARSLISFQALVPAEQFPARADF
jgi:cystathionine beta-synthase